MPRYTEPTPDNERIQGRLIPVSRRRANTRPAKIEKIEKPGQTLSGAQNKVNRVGSGNNLPNASSKPSINATERQPYVNGGRGEQQPRPSSTSSINGIQRYQLGGNNSIRRDSLLSNLSSDRDRLPPKSPPNPNRPPLTPSLHNEHATTRPPTNGTGAKSPSSGSASGSPSGGESPSKRKQPPKLRRRLETEAPARG